VTISPGWYDDPRTPGKERFFDGRAWTTHVRHDVPDIPLAPWVDPSRPGAVAVDTTPPKSSRSLVLSVAAGVLGVALVTGIGASTTLGAIENTGTTDPGPVVAPDPDQGGEPVLPLYSCVDVAGTTLQMARDNGDLDITGWASEPVVVEDNQPIRSLPNEGEQYLVIGCVAGGTFADGHTGDVVMIFTVDHAATVWVDYAEQ